MLKIKYQRQGRRLRRDDRRCATDVFRPTASWSKKFEKKKTDLLIN